MANAEQLSILTQGCEAWNNWRREHSGVSIDLRAADLQGVDLVQANLANVDLSEAQLSGANLTQADLAKSLLVSTNLSGANLTRAILNEAQLTSSAIFRADLTAASLVRANLQNAMVVLSNFTLSDLTQAHLARANLLSALFIRTKLGSTRFDGARLEWTAFIDVDLSSAIGLNDVVHTGPSTLGVDTIVRSSGRIPERFLRGTGLDDRWIAHARSLEQEAPRFSSCFISYATEDQAFAERIHGDLQQNGVRCWFAPRNIRAGRKLHQQIEEAIFTSDRLLLIISRSSMNRDWVSTEIAYARRHEAQENRQILFPISLVPYSSITEWSCVDVQTGEDAAREIREYYILDFSNWRDGTAYRAAFEKLLDGLRE
jgi:hypothetical protein